MKALWREYCLKSTLHGLRYVAEVEKTAIEKAIWSALLTLATVFVFYHLLACWRLFSASPTQITIDNPRYPISKIDFPAVTICPVNKVLYSKMIKLMERYISYNTTINATIFTNSMLALSLMRYPFYNHPLDFMQYESDNLHLIENDKIKDIMLEVMPDINEMFSHCFWRGNRYNCDELLRLQRTEEGFCYSFNSKTAERTSDSSSNVSRKPPFLKANGKLMPLRNNAAGKITGFEFILRSLDHEYLPGDKRMKGYNIVIHNPDDFPDVSTNYMLYAQYRKVFRIGIRAMVLVTDESLNELTEAQRGCTIHRDSARKYEAEIGTLFSKYASNSENNCYIKCRLKAIYEICNCTPYFFRLYESVTYCGIQHIRCLGLNNVLQRNYVAPRGEEGFPAWSLPTYMNCSCIQPCSFVTYGTTMRSTYSDILYPNDELDLYVDVIYEELFATRYRRFLKYNAQDLLVSFGGVASLFLGCSIVSVAEFIYYVVRCVLSLQYVSICLSMLKEILRALIARFFKKLTKRKSEDATNTFSIYSIHPYIP